MSGSSRAPCPTPGTPAVPGHPPETRPHPGVAPLASVRALQSDRQCRWPRLHFQLPGLIGSGGARAWPAEAGGQRGAGPGRHVPASHPAWPRAQHLSPALSAGPPLPAALVAPRPSESRATRCPFPRHSLRALTGGTVHISAGKPWPRFPFRTPHRGPHSLLPSCLCLPAPHSPLVQWLPRRSSPSPATVPPQGLCTSRARCPQLAPPDLHAAPWRPTPQSRTWHAGGILWCLAKWTSSRCRRAHAARSHLRPVRPSACCPASAQQISLSLVQAEGSKVCPEQGGVVPLFERDFLEKGPRGGPGQSIGRKESPAWGAQADPRQLPGGGILCFWPQSQAVPERGSVCGVGRRGWGADEQGSDRHALPGPLPPRLLAALGAELGEGRVWALCLMIPGSSPWSCRCVCQTVGEQKGVVPRPRNSVQLLVKVAAGLGVPLPPCRAATEQQSGEK